MAEAPDRGDQVGASAQVAEDEDGGAEFAEASAGEAPLGVAARALRDRSAV